jgi:hypothetical protein
MKTFINNSVIGSFTTYKPLCVFKLNFGSQHLVAIKFFGGVFVGFNYKLKKIIKNSKMFIVTYSNIGDFLNLKKKTLNFLHGYGIINLVKNLLYFKNYLEINICKLNNYLLILINKIKNFAQNKSNKLFINNL